MQITLTDLKNAGFTDDIVITAWVDDARFDKPSAQELDIDPYAISQETKFNAVKAYQDFLDAHKDTWGLFNLDMVTVLSEYANDDKAAVINLIVGNALYAKRYRIVEQLPKSRHKVLHTQGEYHLIKL